MKNKANDSKRVYPVACQAAYCGDPTACEGCPAFPEKAEFLQWVEGAGATVEDPIWSPTVYTAAS